MALEVLTLEFPINHSLIVSLYEILPILLDSVLSSMLSLTYCWVVDELAKTGNFSNALDRIDRFTSTETDVYEIRESLNMELVTILHLVYDKTTDKIIREREKEYVTVLQSNLFATLTRH